MKNNNTLNDSEPMMYFSKSEADKIEVDFKEYLEKPMKFTKSDESVVKKILNNNGQDILNKGIRETGYTITILFENGKSLTPSEFTLANGLDHIIANHKAIDL